MGCGGSKRRSVSSPTNVVRQEITVETLIGEQETLKIDAKKPVSALYEATKSLFQGRYSTFRLFLGGEELTSALHASSEKQKRLTLVPWPSSYASEGQEERGKLE